MPPRVTRSKVSPGLVDRPNPRRSSTVVAEEKAKKKSAAALKAEDQRRRAAQVAEVEKQIKTAQVEEQQVGRRGGGKVIKKTFQRPNVSLIISPPIFPPTPIPPFYRHSQPKLTKARGMPRRQNYHRRPQRSKSHGTSPALHHHLTCTEQRL